MKSSGPEDVGCRSDEALQEFGVVRLFPNFIFTGGKGVHGIYLCASLGWLGYNIIGPWTLNAFVFCE